MINASIISIGDEICIGQVINSNAAWIADKLTMLGINVRFHSTVKDNAEDIKSELTRLLNVTEIILITGGLGPTHDDITKDVLNDFFGGTLEFSEDVLKSIELKLISRNIRISERNKQMAYLPSNCTILKNDVGTAPGMLFEKNGNYVFSLPGVPAEMKFIMVDSIIPFLENNIQQSDEVVLYRILQTHGIPESSLADKLGNVSEFLANSTLAFLPSAKGVKLRIGAVANNFDECRNEIERIEKIIYKRAGKYIFATGNVRLIQIISEMLKKQRITVSVAESCTGGLLGAEFTSVPGSSAYFMGGYQTYSNESKVTQLGVNKKTIENFGAVSLETAEEMADNVRMKLSTDIGISVTGIAGPDGGSDNKPVGTVWIGLSDSDITMSKKFLLGTQREIVRERAVVAALNMLYLYLTEHVK